MSSRCSTQRARNSVWTAAGCLQQRDLFDRRRLVPLGGQGLLLPLAAVSAGTGQGSCPSLWGIMEEVTWPANPDGRELTSQNWLLPLSSLGQDVDFHLDVARCARGETRDGEDAVQGCKSSFIFSYNGRQ